MFPTGAARISALCIKRPIASKDMHFSNETALGKAGGVNYTDTDIVER